MVNTSFEQNMPIVVKNGYDLDVDSNIIDSTTVHIYISQSKRFLYNSDTSCDFISRVQPTISFFPLPLIFIYLNNIR